MSTSRRSPAIALVVLSILFVALTAIVASGFLRALDTSALDRATAFDDPTASAMASVATFLGQAETTTLLVLAWVLFLWRRGAPGWYVPLGMFVVVGIESVLKLTVAQPLPPTLHRGAEVALIHPAFPFAYPSGHVGRIAFLTALGAGLAAPGQRLPLLAFAIVADLAMMATRLYLGEHWPSDLVGGLLLGAAVASAAILSVGRWRTGR